MERLTYRCFLPDLTGFIRLHCARPNCQHYLSGPDPERKNPQPGFNPAIAVCRLQGTATTPSSAAKSIKNYKIFNGGEGGIRTLGRFEPTPAFQAGPLSQTRTPLRIESCTETCNIYVILWSKYFYICIIKFEVFFGGRRGI